MNSSLERLPISVSLIARNESQTLPRCLESVVPWTREVVVVINDCTDQTADVARSYNASVIEHPWAGFREQKNFAAAQASQLWVLAIDADEAVSAALREEIHAFFRGDHGRFAGASFPRKSWFLGRWITHGDWYPDRVLRLYRKDLGHWGGSAEHCTVELNGALKRFRSDLLHFSSPMIADYLRKFPFYSELYLQRQLEEGAGWSALPVIVRSAWRFVRAYVIRRGFLDGYPGFFIAASTAYGTLFRHTRLYEHQRTRPHHVSNQAFVDHQHL